jgi:hypothetical protein
MSFLSRRTATFYTVATAFILASLIEKHVVLAASMTVEDIEEGLHVIGPMAW